MLQSQSDSGRHCTSALRARPPSTSSAQPRAYPPSAWRVSQTHVARRGRVRGEDVRGDALRGVAGRDERGELGGVCCVEVVCLREAPGAQERDGGVPAFGQGRGLAAGVGLAGFDWGS